MSNETDFGGLGVCHKLSIIHHPIPFMSMAPSVGCKPVLSLQHQAFVNYVDYFTLLNHWVILLLSAQP